jgi:PST family polysaccharide transporter
MAAPGISGKAEPGGAPAPAGAAPGSAKIVGNVLSLGGGELASRLVAFVGTSYLARVLGPAGFGIVGFATALTGYFALAVNAGFHGVGAREVARRPDEAPAIAAGAILVKLLLAVGALAALGVAAWLLDKPPTVKLVVVLSGLSLFTLALDTAWVYKGLERNRRVAAALVLGQASYVATALLVVRGPDHVVRVPLAQFFGELAAALLLAVPLLRSVGTRVNVQEGWHLLRSLGPLIITRVLRLLVFSFDVVLIGLLVGDRAVGLYAAPYRICFLLLTVAAAIHASYMPAVTRAARDSAAEVARVAGRSVELSAAVAAPLIVGGMILAVPLLQLAFGPQYVEGAAAFRLLLLSIGLFFLHGNMHLVMLARDRLSTETWIMAAAAGSNVGLNLLLIPRYGLIGAALATVVAEGVILLLGLVAGSKMGSRPRLSPVLRPLLAAGMMGAVLVALGPGRSLALSLAVGGAAYVGVLVITGGIPQDARAFFRRSAPTPCDGGG